MALKSAFRLAILVLTFCVGPSCVSQSASQQEDVGADTAASAFVNIRAAAGLPKLNRIGRNVFRKQACTHDLRFPSGLIKNVVYETSNPDQLPEAARQLAVGSDSGKTAARFGIGVCSMKTNPPGQPVYSIIIATYESRSSSFWRIFWN
jgi:hypothetical protein